MSITSSPSQQATIKTPYFHQFQSVAPVKIGKMMESALPVISKSVREKRLVRSANRTCVGRGLHTCLPLFYPPQCIQNKHSYKISPHYVEPTYCSQGKKTDSSADPISHQQVPLQRWHHFGTSHSVTNLAMIQELLASGSTTKKENA